MEINSYKLISDVRRIASENPDFVYVADPYCLYFNRETGDPSCIIGQALAKQGIKLGHLRGPRNGMFFSALLKELGIVIPLAHSDWLCSVQSLQDDNTPWGEIVRETDLLLIALIAFRPFK